MTLNIRNAFSWAISWGWGQDSINTINLRDRNCSSWPRNRDAPSIRQLQSIFPGGENRFVELVLTSAGVHIYKLFSQLPQRPAGYVGSGEGGERNFAFQSIRNHRNPWAWASLVGFGTPERVAVDEWMKGGKKRVHHGAFKYDFGQVVDSKLRKVRIYFPSRIFQYSASFWSLLASCGKQKLWRKSN